MPDLFFLIVGIVLALFFGYGIILKIKAFFMCTEKTEAVITGLIESTQQIRGSTLHSYQPKYEFTVDGKTYTGEAPFSSIKTDKYKVGDHLKLRYAPKNPDIVCFPHFDSLLFFFIIMFTIGAVLIICYFL